MTSVWLGGGAVWAGGKTSCMAAVRGTGVGWALLIGALGVCIKGGNG